MPPLTIDQILEWADSHFQRTDQWPTPASGLIPEALGETWGAIQAALSGGARGRPGGSSLPRLLAEHRGRKNRKDQLHFTEEQILEWMDAHHHRTGTWPTVKSGSISEAPSETWSAVQAALQQGSRGLLGGSSLAQLLARHRGVKNVANPPALSVEQILVWADEHKGRTGRWPVVKDGDVYGVAGETWAAIDAALRTGGRSLPGDSSLAMLLADHRGVRNTARLPQLEIDQILKWADAHHQRIGEWPTLDSGSVHDSPDETWSSIGRALYNGGRGLPGRSSLAQLLAERRKVRNSKMVPKLTIEIILGWANAHRERTGVWPKQDSGPVDGVPNENWKKVNNALRIGLRGLPGGSSLVSPDSEHGGKLDA